MKFSKISLSMVAFIASTSLAQTAVVKPENAVVKENLKGEEYSIISGKVTEVVNEDPAFAGISASAIPAQILFAKHQDSEADDADSSQAFHFMLEDGGTLDIANYCKKSTVNDVYVDCLVYHFERQGDELIVSQGVSSDASSVHDISPFFSTIKADSDIYLQMDIHAHEAPAHLMVWNKAEAPFEEQEAVFDSERDDLSSDFTYDHVGFDRLVTFSSATLYSATLSGPVFVHED